VPADPTIAVHLIQKVANQDRDAFSQLYDRFSTLVFTLAMRILKFVPTQITSGSFVQVWRQAQKLWRAASSRKHGSLILRAAGRSTKYVLSVEWKKSFVLTDDPARSGIQRQRRVLAAVRSSNGDEQRSGKSSGNTAQGFGVGLL
jgi:hypothetical protein